MPRVPRVPAGVSPRTTARRSCAARRAFRRPRPYLRSFAQVVYEDRNVATQIFGTTRDYFTVRSMGRRRGRDVDGAAETTGERVCVLGTTTAANLFGTLDPVGRLLRIGRYPYRVAGVLESKGQSPFGTDQDDIVLVPSQSFRSHVMATARKGVHGIIFAARPAPTPAIAPRPRPRPSCASAIASPTIANQTSSFARRPNFAPRKTRSTARSRRSCSRSARCRCSWAVSAS